MKYKLFYAANSASMGVRVIFEEIGLSYELVASTIDRTLPRPPKQLAINPNGWIPAIFWDGGAMYEAAAITVYLCDRHPESNLAPAIDAPERAVYLQTMVFFSNSIQNAFQLYYYPGRFANTKEQESGAQKRGIRRLHETWKVIDDQIGDREWILGDKFSAVDIYLFMLTTWLNETRGHPSTREFPNVKRVADAVKRRPSVQLVYQEGIANQTL